MSSEWDKDQNGNIVALPVKMYEIAPVVSYDTVLVRLELVTDENATEKVQIALQRGFALSLAKDLRHAADQIEKATKRADKKAKKSLG